MKAAAWAIAPKSPARVVVVVALAALVLALTLPDAARRWHPLGSLKGGTQNIAARGDVVDLPATPYLDRIRVVVGFVALPGGVVRVAVAHRERSADGTVRRTIALEKIAGEDRAGSDNLYYALIMIREIVALLFVALGSTLVLLRPSTLTWMLFVFCLRVAASAPALALQAYLPTFGADLDEIFYDIVPTAGYVSALVFAARFPDRRTADWRDWCVRGAPWIFVALGALGIFSEYGRIWFGWDALTNATSLFLRILDGAVCLVAVAALITAERNAAASQKPWMRTVTAAFAVSLAGLLLDETFDTAYLLHSSLLMLSGVVFVAIVYSVVRYRFLEIEAYVRPAVVGTILSSTALLLFVALSGRFDKLLEANMDRLGVPAALSVVATIGIPALLHRLFTGGEKVLESLAYRQRIDARERMRALTVEISDAGSIEQLTELLCARVAEILGLASAAFFRSVDARVFLREKPSFGWNAGDPDALERGGKLVHDIDSSGTAHPVRVDVGSERLDHIPGMDSNLAVAFRMRGRLAAFAIYGGFRHGDKWESEDVESLGGLTFAAVAALYHIESGR